MIQTEVKFFSKKLIEPYCTSSLKVFILEDKIKNKIEEIICSGCCCLTGCSCLAAGDNDPSQVIQSNSFN
jgi:hypothetical protein